MVNQSKVMVEPLERPLKDSDFEATHSRPPWVPRVDKRGDPVPWELFRYFIDPKKVQFLCFHVKFFVFEDFYNKNLLFYDEKWAFFGVFV